MWTQLSCMLACVSLAVPSNDITRSSKLCESKHAGDVIPNPFNCQSYFVCGEVPTLQYCDEGLHYDRERNVCNWPQFANCQLAQNLREHASDVIDGSSAETQFDYILPPLMAIDVESGRVVEPMEKYDPKHVECRHYGAYFLPHPNDCNRYFICAYGHMHMHWCGPNTWWNYRTTQCESGDNVQCYSHDHEDGGMVIASSSPATTVESSISNRPTPIPTYRPTPTQTSTSKPTESTPSSTMMTMTAPTLPSNGIPTNDSPIIMCPSNRQAYLPHPRDCTKYYICIVGMPVLTWCPKGLYWDHEAQYCGLPNNVKCYQK